MSQEPTPPYTRRRSEEVPADRLTDFRLKQLEEAVQTCSDTSSKVLAALNEMNSRLAVGAERFVNVDKRIESLEGDRRWTVMALLSALGSLVWQLLTSLMHGGPKLLAAIGAAQLMAGCSLGVRASELPPAPPGSDAFDTFFLWALAIGVLGMGASIAALVWLPVLKRTALAMAAGFGTIIGCAVLINAARPFLPWVALALVLCAVAIGILELRKRVLCPEVTRG